MAGLAKKRVILGVTGSIAAFKAAELASDLAQLRARVTVVLTAAAERFVTRHTFTGLTGVRALTSLWDETTDLSSEHIHLAATTDLIVIAPASADFIARIALGLADDLLGAILLASPAPLIVAPAMETHMYLHPATQANLATLRSRAVAVVGPVHGRLASGDEGTGRMSEPDQVIACMEARVAGQFNRDLASVPLVITAGPTQEPVDPVRYISNRSSGKMGYELVRAAARRGALVTLISGPVDPSLRNGLPDSVVLVDVATSEQMQEAVLRSSAGARAVIMAAAVADFRPSMPADSKIKKTGDSWSLQLEQTEDVLSSLQSHRPEVLRVGFAAETDDVVANATDKLERKNLAMIVANRVAISGPSVFGSDVNQVTIIRRDGVRAELATMPKANVADAVLDHLRDLLAPPESSE